MTTYPCLRDLRGLIGAELGVSEWIDIDQARIQMFADATDDHQWIHLDEERARGGPFGTTVAHGFLTLSLVPWMMGSAYEISDVEMTVNYGLDRVRFPSPVRAGSIVRGRLKLLNFDDIAGGAQVTVEVTIEAVKSNKPACVAESVCRLLVRPA